MRLEASASGSSVSEETVCFGASGLARVAARRMISMPKPGSMLSILSQRSRVKRFTSRTGRAVPMRMASMQLSTR
jgi:hypothetical protein